MTITKRAINEQQKKQRRQHILDTALAAYETSSYEAVSMAALAQQVGVAKGTLYLYFSSKEALFLQLLTQAFADWFDALDSGLAAETTEEGITKVIALLGSTLAERPVFIRLMVIMHTVLEKNIDLTTAVQFKQFLRQRVLQTAPLLQKRLPFLTQSQAATLLLQIYALVIGLQQQANPAPVIKQAFAAKAELAELQIEFMPTLLATIQALLQGLAWQKEQGNHNE